MFFNRLIISCFSLGVNVDYLPFFLLALCAFLSAALLAFVNTYFLAIAFSHLLFGFNLINLTELILKAFFFGFILSVSSFQPVSFSKMALVAVAFLGSPIAFLCRPLLFLGLFSFSLPSLLTSCFSNRKVFFSFCFLC